MVADMFVVFFFFMIDSTWYVWFANSFNGKGKVYFHDLAVMAVLDESLPTHLISFKSLLGFCVDH